MSSMDVNKYYCGGTVCITVEGDVTPCSVIRQGFGNVHHLPFAEIINRHRSELLFLPLRDEGTRRRVQQLQKPSGLLGVPGYGILYNRGPYGR